MIKENIVVRWLWEHILPYFEKQIHNQTYNAVSTLDVFSPALIAKLDVLILPGCVLTDAFFTIYGNFLEQKVQQGTKLIFLGASGNYYTKKEISIVVQWLEKLKPYAIIFRDSIAYEHYKKYSNNVYNGIDNVFFVNRLNLPKIETTMDPYVVLNFDVPKHKKYKKKIEMKTKEKQIVYTDHKPYPYIKVSNLAKKNIMCSDFPLDYLFLYRNATETHSDRVHACIPTLSFGNKAQLYSDSPRVALFENVGIDVCELKKHPIAMDMELLKDLQNKQILYLKKLLDAISCGI